MATKILKVPNDISDPFPPNRDASLVPPVPMPIWALATYKVNEQYTLYRMLIMDKLSSFLIFANVLTEIQHVRIHFGRWGDCVGVTRTLRGPARRLMG